LEDLAGFVLEHETAQADDVGGIGVLGHRAEKARGEKKFGSGMELFEAGPGIESLGSKIAGVQERGIGTEVIEVMVHGADGGKGALNAELGFHQLVGLAEAEMVREEPLLDFLLLLGGEGVPAGVAAKFFHGDYQVSLMGCARRVKYTKA